MQVCLCKVLWSCLLGQLLGRSLPVVIQSICSHLPCRQKNGLLLYKIREWQLKVLISFLFGQLMEASTYGTFPPFPCASNADYHARVHGEFSGNFSYRSESISLDDCSQMVNFWGLFTELLIFQVACFFSTTSCTTTSLCLFEGQMCCWRCKLSPVLYYPFLTCIRKLLNGSAGKSTCCQSQWPEFNPPNTHDWRRESTPIRYPLTYTCMLRYMQPTCNPPPN